MKKVILAMLVSGMLFGCTNNQSEETSAVDSTAVETETTHAEIQSEDSEALEFEVTADSVETDSIIVVE